MALRQAETGTKVKEVIRQLGITEQTFYRRKRKYGGLGTSELRRLRMLEEENKKLKQMVADLSLDKAMLQGGDRKKTLKAAEKRLLVAFLQESFQVNPASRLPRLAVTADQLPVSIRTEGPTRPSPTHPRAR